MGMTIIIIAIFLFLVLVGLILIALFRDIRIIQSTWEDYFSAIPHSTPSQLKGPIVLNQSRILTKLFINMKKYLGLALLSIVLAAIVGSGLIVYNSREYFVDYFEVQRTKLNLRNEASVDSLQTIITNYTVSIDSFDIVLAHKNIEIKGINSKKWEDSKTIKNLQNVINHQNTMVNKLQRENVTLKSLTKKPKDGK